MNAIFKLYISQKKKRFKHENYHIFTIYTVTEIVNMELADLSLLDDAPPYLDLDSEPLFVTLGDIGTVDVDVNFEDSIFYVKRELHKLFGILPRYQRLYFGVEELEDHRTLYSYGIRPYGDIDLVLKYVANLDDYAPKYKIRLNYIRSIERDIEKGPLYD